MSLKHQIAAEFQNLNIRRDTQYLQLCKLSGYVNIFNTLHSTWRVTHPEDLLNFDLPGLYGQTAMNFILHEEDSMNGYAVQSILDALERLKCHQTSKHNVQDHKVWVLHYIIDEMHFIVRFYYGGSKHCKVIETGNMIPETEIKCE